MKTFNTRTEVINALSSEFNHNPAGFNNTATNSSIEKFWTLNRLVKHYWDIKRGRKETYKTQLNKSTGYYELKPAKTKSNYYTRGGLTSPLPFDGDGDII